MIIGIGTDIVQLSRIDKISSHEGFLRVLTPLENAMYEHFQGQRQVEWLAGRFAAKEAIYKAIHKLYPCVISEIEILSDEDGAPYCYIEDLTIHISIAHEKDYAIAFAIASTKE